MSDSERLAQRLWSFEARLRLLFAHLARGRCGRRARGWLAIGGMSLGGITCGGLTLGLVSFGGLAAGAFALGGLAAGFSAIGGVALGYYALGGAAFGAHVITGIARDPAAMEFFRATGLAWLIDRLLRRS